MQKKTINMKFQIMWRHRHFRGVYGVKGRNILGMLNGWRTSRRSYSRMKVRIRLIYQKRNWEPDRKAPGPDNVQGYWLKNLSPLHYKLLMYLQVHPDSGAGFDWLTKAQTVLIPKDKAKRNIAGNYRDRWSIAYWQNDTLVGANEKEKPSNCIDWL